MKQQHYSVQEIEDLTGLSRSTIERDIRKGRLSCIQRVPHGTRWVDRAELVAWWNVYGRPNTSLNLRDD